MSVKTPEELMQGSVQTLYRNRYVSEKRCIELMKEYAAQFLNQPIKEILQDQDEDGWISVKDRLPDTHRVRFMDNSANIWEGNFSKTSGAWYAYCVNQEILAHTVKYWQPQSYVPKDPRAHIPRNMNEWCEVHQQYYKDECKLCANRE